MSILLAVLFLTGCIGMIISKGRSLNKELKGMSGDQITEFLKKNPHKKWETLADFVFGVIYTFIIEPGAVIWAFYNRIGNEFVAIAVALIIVFELLELIRFAKEGLKLASNPAYVLNSNITYLKIYRIITTIPTLYLGYLAYITYS